MAQAKNTNGLKKIWMIIIGLVVVLVVLLVLAGSNNQSGNENKTSADNSGPGTADFSPEPPSEVPPAPEAKDQIKVFEVVAAAEGGYTAKDVTTGEEVVLFIAADTNVQYLDDLTAIRPGNFLRVSRYREGGNGVVVLDMSVSKELTSPSGGSELPANPEAASNQ